MSAPSGSKQRQMEGMLDGPVPEITPEERARIIGLCEALAKNDDERVMFGGMLLGDDIAS